MPDDPTIVPQAGGQGEPIRVDPHHTRQHLNMMERMVRLGTLTPEQQGEIRDEALIIMRKADKARDKSACLRVLAALERNDIKKLELALVAGGVGRHASQSTVFTGPVQFNIVGKDPESMTIDELDAYIAQRERELDAGPTPGAPGQEGGTAPKA